LASVSVEFRDHLHVFYTPPFICPDIDSGFPQPRLTTTIKTTDHKKRLTTRTKKNDRPRRLTTTIKTTDHEERLITIKKTDNNGQEERLTTKNDWPRWLTTIWLCTILTYEDASVCNFLHTWTCLDGKFPLFCSLRKHYGTCSLLKSCVCTHLLTHESMIMCSFEHNFPLVHPMWRVSTKLFQLRDVTTCKFSLKRRISALVWLTWTPPCATFDICGHVST